jgi:hypothetical protein
MTLKYTVKYGSEGVKPGYICLNNKYVNNIG